MRILLTGASGFIGQAIAAALVQRGHEVVPCIHSRKAGSAGIAVDYMRDLEPAAWLPRLAGIDVVINAVGILRENVHASFDNLHHRAPAALFRACEQAGVRRVIQISALGADEQANSAYHLSKKAADDLLRELDLDWTVVQPSVVFGMGGGSTNLFLRMASLPVVPLVGRGDQAMQPIHIDDLAALIVRLVEDRAGMRETIAAVGSTPLTMREMLSEYRRQMHLGTACFLPMPLPLMRLAARVGTILPAAPLSPETLGMLLRGNTSDATEITTLLGRAPRPSQAFISSRERALYRAHAVNQWLRPLLLLSIAFMWLAAGTVSWFHAPEHGLALLGKLGLPPFAAQIALASACLLNIGLGIASLRPSRTVWAVQLATMVCYTAALTWIAPAMWLDPFGPLVKNIPLAAAILGLMSLESET